MKSLPKFYFGAKTQPLIKMYATLTNHTLPPPPPPPPPDTYSLVLPRCARGAGDTRPRRRRIPAWRRSSTDADVTLTSHTFKILGTIINKRVKDFKKEKKKKKKKKKKKTSPKTTTTTQ